MSKDTSKWSSPLAGRYASPEMLHLWSPDMKFGTWRRLWVALAKAECQLGLKQITDEQIREMIQHVDDINYDVANAREREVKHDVMAHVHAYGVQCPKAAGIIHLGATSCYVTDNTDILLMRDGLELLKRELLQVIENLADFAEEYKDLPCLGYTHGQPATPTTVGKRATLWLQNFEEDLYELTYVSHRMKMLGCRGATGTSETYMKLFDGDEMKVRQLDKLIAAEMGFDPTKVYPVSGQTYPRNFDARVLNCLANIATSAMKMATDIRFLQHDKELEEPFGKNQIGSSAMAYKRNPMRCERICSLGRYVQELSGNAYATAGTQWLERTLDDSANRRISLPEGFLATDAILLICANVTDGLVVYPEMIKRHLEAELPFMVTEDILMRAVERGGDRQELHERIRKHSMDAAMYVKQDGQDNRLLEFILDDEAFAGLLTPEDIEEMMNPRRLTGRCPGQVEEYLSGTVRLLLEHYSDLLKKPVDSELKV